MTFSSHIGHRFDTNLEMKKLEVILGKSKKRTNTVHLFDRNDFYYTKVCIYHLTNRFEPFYYTLYLFATYICILKWGYDLSQITYVF